MEKHEIHKLLLTAAAALKLEVSGPPAFGWHYKTAGSQVADVNGNIRWLRVLACPAGQNNGLIWLGLKTAGTIKNVSKPSWFGEYVWEENGLRCRADILEFVEDKPISDAPELRVSVRLSSKWLRELRTSLEHLHQATTGRVCVRQDLVTRRLQERFGSSLDTNINEWQTSHGDLHWSNLTFPRCCLLDWEAWGTAPKGFDVAMLYCFTLKRRQTAKLIYDCFKDWLESPTGKKAQMFACAELMRMTELYSDHVELYPQLKRRAEQLALEHGVTVLTPK